MNPKDIGKKKLFELTDEEYAFFLKSLKKTDLETQNIISLKLLFGATISEAVKLEE